MELRLRLLLGALPPRFRWTLHNLVAHPLSEVLFQLGCEGLADAVHNWTTPMGDED